MLVKLDKENNRYSYTPTVYMDNNTESCEGLDLTKTYQVNYEFLNSKYKRTVFKDSGWRLLEGYSSTLNFLFDNPEWSDEDMRNLKIEVPKMVFTLYGTYLLKRSDFNKLFNHYKECFGPELGQIVKKGIKKGKGKDFEIVKNIMCMYIWKHFSGPESNQGDILTVIDTPQMKEGDFDEIRYRKEWKEQPITERLGLKTYEEFKEVILNEFGSLQKRYESSNLIRKVS